MPNGIHKPGTYGIRRPTKHSSDKAPVGRRESTSTNGNRQPTPEHKNAVDPNGSNATGEERVATELSVATNYDGSEGRLQGRLDKAISRTSFKTEERRGFLPDPELSSLVCKEAVVKELTKVEESFRKRVRFWKKLRSSKDIEVYAGRICGQQSESNGEEGFQPRQEVSFRKIFAILLLIGKPSKIVRFVEEGVSDDKLPLAKVTREHWRNSIDLHLKGFPEMPLRCFEALSRSQVVHFEKLQWSMLAPCFVLDAEWPRQVRHYDFKPDEIMPFTLWKQFGNSGGYGQVFKTKIHPDHHNFKFFTSETFFAVKRLKSRDKEDFEREVRILRRLSGRHDHLISLLVTYEQHRKFHLVFHWAEADLLRYWKRVNREPIADSTTVQWVAQQCQGIAEGLSLVHRYQTYSGSSLVPYCSSPNTKGSNRRPTKEGESSPDPPIRLLGRHGDIKPENILWFSTPGGIHGKGTLKICDFGIAEFNPPGTEWRQGKGGVPNSATYRPPECDLEDSIISSAYDIWTLGCVYLEFITWVFGGCSYLEGFARSRQAADGTLGIIEDSFFTIEQGSNREASVKPSVTKLIDDLRVNPKCTQFFRTFLIMIEEKMLIAKLSNPDESNSYGRTSCKNIADELATMYKNCLEIPGYASCSTAAETDSSTLLPPQNGVHASDFVTKQTKEYQTSKPSATIIESSHG
ncbi:Fc.00g043260.m01.CDS01 [Cosmosporella sp. VM-42]